MDPKTFFSRLWSKYTNMAPSVQRIHDAFEDEDGDIVNDHVAFRTFNTPALNIDKLTQHFYTLGYVKDSSYQFPEKKLDAIAFLDPDGDLPRIFISEIRVEELSEATQAIIRKYISPVNNDLANDITCLWSGRPWAMPSWEDYQNVLAESEYAAWLLVHGLCANHFTISVNHLRNPELELVNLQLDALGCKVNQAGGAIKGSPDDLLEQSSTMADEIYLQFACGTEHAVTTCYYEFAKRYNDSTGKLFQGFIATSADKIFESTDMKK